MQTCKHERCEPRLRTKSNGAVVVANQCLECGSSLGELKKSEHNVSLLKPFDNSIRENWNFEENLEFQKRQEEFATEHKNKTSEWWTAYKIYLKSEHWRKTRMRVLTRDSVCQMCYSEPATQAHHLTYDSFSKLGFSFSVECVGVCDSCHAMIHREVVA